MIEQQHSLRRYNISCQYWPDSNTRDQTSQSLPSASGGTPEGYPEGAILFYPERIIPLALEGGMPLATEVASSCQPSQCLDSVPDGDNNVDNNNGTASGRPRRNRRVLTQYNPQYNIHASQWVSNQQALVVKFFLDYALDGTFIMDSWR